MPETMTTSLTKSKGSWRRSRKVQLTLSEELTATDNRVMIEFIKAYNILVECIMQKDKFGYSALIGKLVSESQPPCNIGYLNAKIKLDKDLSRTIDRIYKLVKLS
jgi:hypothetical protein